MADAVESGVCDLVGLGRAAVLQPDLPAKSCSIQPSRIKMVSLEQTFAFDFDHFADLART